MVPAGELLALAKPLLYQLEQDNQSRQYVIFHLYDNLAVV